MTEIRILKTEAPFNAQSNGIDVGFLELEVNAATGIVVTAVSTDSTDIIFDYVVTPPTEAAVLAVVIAHDGRDKGKVRVVSQGLPAFVGNPRHASVMMTVPFGTAEVTESKIDTKCRLLGGSLWVGSDAKFGDTIRVDVVDVDGVLGPSGTILSTPVPGMHMPPGGTGQGRMSISSGQAMPLPKDVYLRFTYTSVGASGDVKAIAYWTEVHDAA